MITIVRIMRRMLVWKQKKKQRLRYILKMKAKARVKLDWRM